MAEKIFTLATYNSQLVLVGGVNGNGEDVNGLLVSSDGIDWQQSLPPMPTRRHGVLAVNTGSPECLIVMGGYVGEEYLCTTTVEVLLEDQWSTVQPIPFSLYRICTCTPHNGNLFFEILHCDNYSQLMHCKLESLIMSCRQSKSEYGSD